MATLSKREKYIVFGVGGAIALYLLNTLIWEPYDKSLQGVRDNIAKVAAQTEEGSKLLGTRSALNKTLKEMTANGLQSDPTLAESQAINALNDWARDCRVSISAINPERWTQEGAFTAINFHVTANGSTAAISRMLHAIESSSLPVRVADLALKSTKEQTDDLQLQMSFSTLCITSDMNKKPKSGSSSSVTANAGSN